ncbi:hypothetical protein CRYUN_Cryun11dG0122900 [Craigia yunnanensis]
MATSAVKSTSLSFFSSSLFLSSSSAKLPTRLSFSFKTSSKPNLSISSQLSSLPILSFTGEKIGETYLDLKSAPPETARAVRRGTASTLTRSEVRGGGKKPYPQKKTGRARRGSTRSPLLPGGGVIFGPKPRDWSIKINKKEKRLAISTALSSAAENTIVVEEFGDKFEKPKTKEFIEALKRWGLDPKQKSMFLMMEVPENVSKSSRNIGTLRMLTPRTLNLFDILNCDNMVLTPDAVDYLNGRYGEDYEDDTEDDDEEEEEEEGGEEAEENADAEQGPPFSIS